jgi:hypothetical protein
MDTRARAKPRTAHGSPETVCAVRSANNGNTEATIRVSPRCFADLLSVRTSKFAAARGAKLLRILWNNY